MPADLACERCSLRFSVGWYHHHDFDRASELQRIFERIGAVVRRTETRREPAPARALQQSDRGRDPPALPSGNFQALG